MDINNEGYLKARISAFKFITFKRRTIKEVENKLKSLEINPQYIESIIEELIELKYLNDEIYIEKFVEKSNKLSINMIKLRLKEKGIPSELINSYFSKNIKDEQEEIIGLLKKRKFSLDLSIDEQNKIKVYLVRKGFNKNDVERAIQVLRSDLYE